MSKKVVILGAGYGGLLAAMNIRKYLNKDQAQVTVINQYPTHQIITELHRLAAGSVAELLVNDAPNGQPLAHKFLYWQGPRPFISFVTFAVREMIRFLPG